MADTPNTIMPPWELALARRIMDSDRVPGEKIPDDQLAFMRLLATVEAYGEIVAAVAKRSGAVTSGDPEWSYCMFNFDYDCEDGPDQESVTHAPDCPWVKARALLAGTPAPGSHEHVWVEMDPLPGHPDNLSRLIGVRCAICGVKREDTPAPGTTDATDATAFYSDLADHEHDWRPIESRTAPDAEGHLIVWHRTQCRVCGLISELSVNPWTGATAGESPQQPAD